MSFLKKVIFEATAEDLSARFLELAVMYEKALAMPSKAGSPPPKPVKGGLGGLYFGHPTTPEQRRRSWQWNARRYRWMGTHLKAGVTYQLRVQELDNLDFFREEVED